MIQLDALAELLNPSVAQLVVLQSGMASVPGVARTSCSPSDEPRVVLAAGRYIGKGFDDPRLDTLVLAIPIAWKGTMTRYAGRLHATTRSTRSGSSTPSTTKSRSCDACTPSAVAPAPTSATGLADVSPRLAHTERRPLAAFVCSSSGGRARLVRDNDLAVEYAFRAGCCSLNIESAKALVLQVLPSDGRGGFRTCDLSRVKRALSH